MTINMNDIINSLFEFGGAILSWANACKLYKDQKISGVYWPTWFFWSTWGLWNLYYYPSLDQMWSFLAGIVLVAGNIAWLLLAMRIHFRKNT